MDKIVLKGIHVETLIGWHAWEREALRPMIVDLVMTMPNSQACLSDDLADTIDYEAIVNDLRHVLLAQHFLLIEALAEYIASRLLQDFAVPHVEVTVTKPGVLWNVSSVSVKIERGTKS